MKNIVVFTLLLSCFIPAHGQSIQDIDQHLASYLNKLDYWDRSTSDNREDSLSQADENFIAYLKKVCTKYPLTMKGAFPKAEKAGLTIVSSNDHMLRVYSWDCHLGGTMRYYEDFAQYQTTGGIKVVNMKDTAVEGDYGGEYRAITTIHTTNNQTIYLLQDYNISSTKDRGEDIMAYTVDGALLKQVNFFHTATKSLNTIGYGYDMFASEDKYPKGDIPCIHLSNDNKKLYIPIVNGEIVTNKYLVYVFDGNNYVFDKNAK